MIFLRSLLPDFWKFTNLPKTKRRLRHFGDVFFCFCAFCKGLQAFSSASANQPLKASMIFLAWSGLEMVNLDWAR